MPAMRSSSTGSLLGPKSNAALNPRGRERVRTMTRRGAARREDDLTDALRAEDAQIQKEQELKTKAAHDAATASGSADARLRRESS